MANEKTIWTFLRQTFNPYATAGIMGNLYAESALKPTNLQGTFEKKLGYSDDSYTAAVDNGSYTNFVKDSAGYGLAQWTYWSRKQKLLNYAKDTKRSIGNLEMQLEFLVKELKEGYNKTCYTPLMSVKSVLEASNIMLLKFERPANQGESVQAKRASYGQKYYDMFMPETAQPQKEEPTVATNYDKYIFSTGTHYISNSGGDENRGTRGGQAGDQTGKEWELKGWYNRPWSVILRWPNQTVAQTIAKLSIDAALNNKIGYDQGQRNSYWNELQKVDYNPAKITTPCEEDCTAGVSANVKAAGYIHNIPALKNLPICSSRNMRQEFVKAGFRALTESKYLTDGKYLFPGDILLYERHHGAANITLGAAVKDSWDPSKDADQVQTIVEFKYVLGDRTIKSGMSGDDVKDLQEKLNKLGYKISKIDGKCGDVTVGAIKAFQEDYKLTADGLFGAKSLAALKNALAKLEETIDVSWFTRTLKKGMQGEDVRILQGKLIQKGYNVGKAGPDGKFGNNTLSAVMLFQKDHGLKVDGLVGKKTIAALG